MSSFNFCDCKNTAEGTKPCDCAYVLNGYKIKQHRAWAWSTTEKSTDSQVTDSNQTVYFHIGYSIGNACVAGNTPFVKDHHYFWEISIVRPVYGSSVMIGIGTANVDVNKYANQFCNLLGDDDQSWGLSFRGTLHHKGTSSYYHPRAGFSLGSVVGVHLNMWTGTLQYYINREPLGIAFTDLRDLKLYPMISSTAAHSSMKLTYSIIIPHSLSFLTLQILSLEDFQKLPFLLKEKLSECWWLFPKSSASKQDVRILDSSLSHSGIYVSIDSDEEDSEGSNVLALRMKRVLENSRSFSDTNDSPVIALRPLPKRIRKEKP